MSTGLLDEAREELSAHAYRLGNRSALEWVIDQYQVSTDERSVTNDPTDILFGL